MANSISGAAVPTAAARRVRILIADEQALSRANIRKALDPQRRIEVVGEAHDVETTISLATERSPHVVLLDYRLSKKLAAGGEHLVPPVIRIITLAAPDKTEIIESFRLGANGIMLKESPHRIWWRGIGAVLAGQYWLGNESLAVLIQAIRERPAEAGSGMTARHFGLTPREIEIVQKIADGRSNKEVSEDCSIRERTVKHHLTNIFTKVGVSSRLELAVFARDKLLALAGATNSFEVNGPEAEAVRAQPKERRNKTTPRQSSNGRDRKKLD